MKTTIDLPDDLFMAVKRRAAEDCTTVRAIVERGLRLQLRVPPPAARRAGAARIKWVTVDGGLPAGLYVNDRAAMHDRRRRDR